MPTLNNEVDVLNVANIDNDIRDSFTRAMIAPEEKETYSTHDYAINKFFIWNDRNLYKVIAPITTGDTFALNTNIELAGRISDQLYELFEQSPDVLEAALTNVEDRTTASKPYKAGQYIIWSDGNLYKVTVDTYTGTTWAVGTNISQITNLSDMVSRNTTSLTDVQNLYGAKNLWDDEKVEQYKIAGTYGFIKNGHTWTNDRTDDLTSFHLRLKCRVSGGSSAVDIYSAEINTTGVKEFTISAIPTGITELILQHDGTSSDMNLDIPKWTYTFSGPFKLQINVQGCNPSIVGGLVLSDIMIYRDFGDSTYKPYVMTNSELTLSNKLNNLSFVWGDEGRTVKGLISNNLLPSINDFINTLGVDLPVGTTLSGAFYNGYASDPIGPVDNYVEGAFKATITGKSLGYEFSIMVYGMHCGGVYSDEDKNMYMYNSVERVTSIFTGTPV